jgi:endonuclease G
MPNDQGIENEPWQKYIVTPAMVEKATGYQFFTALPADVRQALEQKLDTGRASRR